MIISTASVKWGTVGGAVNVIAVPERVSLNHESSAGAGIFKKAPQLHIQYALVLFQPLLIKTVYKIVGTAVAELYAEKYVQTYLLTPCLGVLVALAVKLHTLFPRQIMGYGAVAVEKMVGDDYSRIALRLIFVSHLNGSALGAVACFGGVHMCFVDIH